MPDVSKSNYSNVERPYDAHLVRTDTNETDDMSVRAPFQMYPAVLNNRSFNNVWIQNFIKSSNFKPKSSGFFIDGRRGFIECQKIFTQDIDIGNRFLVVDTSSTIQQAVDTLYNRGGGIVALRNGVHKPGMDITLRKHVYIQGQSADNCTVDFENGNFGFQITGSDAYTTGTVSIATADTTVTGVGTTFTSAMVGRYILLSGLWCEISSFTDTTHVEITLPYVDEALSGATFVIADKIDDTRLADIRIRRSNTAAIRVQYSNETFFHNILVQESLVAVDIDDMSNLELMDADFVANGICMQMTNMHFASVRSSGSGLTTIGGGWVLDTVTNSIFDGNVILASAGNGMEFTDCKDLHISSLAVKTSGNHGIEFVSGNTDIALFGCSSKSNAGDGLKITGTTDYCKVSHSFFNSNVANGINIANADCDKNIIAHCTLNGNGTAITDSGTGTIQDNNVT